MTILRITILKFIYPSDIMLYSPVLNVVFGPIFKELVSFVTNLEDKKWVVTLYHSMNWQPNIDLMCTKHPKQLYIHHIKLEESCEPILCGKIIGWYGHGAEL